MAGTSTSSTAFPLRSSFCDALHRHRERAWGWGYGHYVLFAAVAAIGSGLEVVADVLKAAHEGADTHGVAPSAAHDISPLLAINVVALAEAVFVGSLWALHCYVARARDRQLRLMLGCLAGIALGPIAVAQGPLPWGLVLLSLGPLVAIVYSEHGRLHCTDRFAVR